jgi:hypothetical protein
MRWFPNYPSTLASLGIAGLDQGEEPEVARDESRQDAFYWGVYS